MHVSRYWHKEQQVAQHRDTGFTYALTSWGGSPNSPTEARQRAFEKLNRWIERLGRGEDLQEYEYANSELREELIEEIHDVNQNLIAAVTRNRYGALILNAADILIADIDIPTQPFLIRLLVSLLGRKGKKKHPTPREACIENLRRLAADHPDWRLVVYDTHSGLRVFETSRAYDPASEESREVLAAFNSDRLYCSLCHAQQCYRARLTPKPWRCNSQRPPNHFPRETRDARHDFDTWLTRYHDRAHKFATCRLRTTIGDGLMTESAMQILAVHDSYVLNDSADQLA